MLLKPKSGVSQSSGNTWMSQEVVIDYFWWPNQRDPSQMVLKVFGEDRIKQYNLQPNDEVKIRYHVEAHEYNDRWFNDVRVDGVTFVGASMAKNPQVLPAANQPSQGANGQAVGQQQAAGNQSQQQAPFPPKVDENGNPITNQGGEHDDLPF